MLTIDPTALGALAVQLAKVDAAHQVMSDAIDALEVAANAGREPERLVCHQAVGFAVNEHTDALLDLVDVVREALYGPDEDEDED